ncbi:MAG: DNA polymerase/3'-5' exonuclease PolX [Candidatus Eremiobacteraeota bacterium]|nr:DNA polymerase/3'-5' exonuclease PolX [Candidatus Eremiobacteraeota bacterium]
MPVGRSNSEVARILREIRTLMEFAGEEYFRFMAYERAADAVHNAAPLADLIAAGELTSLPGVGKTIGGRIEEIVASGTCGYLEELRGRYPPRLIDVLTVPGVGIKTARMLYEQYGIGSLEELEKALDDGRLASAPRFGKKSLENLRRGLLASKGRQRRWPLGFARPLADELIAYLRETTDARDLLAAGSVRRAEPTVGDVDIVCTSTEAEAVIRSFVAFPRAQAVLAEGSTKGSIWLEGGLQIDLRVLPAHLYGNLLQHFTGSREHNIQLREFAVRKNVRVSENGIFNLENGENLTCATEDQVYAALGMAYIPPELRLGLGEIEAAREGTLPRALELADLRGDFHMHSTDSDGADSLEAMIAACAQRGYAYHAISDHSRVRGEFGMDAAALRLQRERARALGERHGIRTLCASEVDIRADGSLVFDDDVLAELDVVIASVHTATNLSRDAMTARLVRACENPFVTIIGHPTGRYVDLFSDFGGYEFDYDAVFAAAVRTGTALEIDGHPNRLDLPSSLARRAKGFGVTFSCDSDAHQSGALANVGYAVGQARRAGLEAADVLNARPLEGVLAFVAAKRARAGAPAKY